MCRVQKDPKKNLIVSYLCEIDFIHPSFTDEESKVQRKKIMNEFCSATQLMWSKVGPETQVFRKSSRISRTPAASLIVSELIGELTVELIWIRTHLNAANIKCLLCAKHTGSHVKDKKKVLGHRKFSVYLLK